MEEAKGVRLHELSVVQQLAQLLCSLWDADGHDHIAGLHRGEQVTDRTDPANTSSDGGHFVERAPLRELFEAPQLGHVESRVGDLTVIIEIDGDPSVSLDSTDVRD